MPIPIQRGPRVIVEWQVPAKLALTIHEILAQMDDEPDDSDEFRALFESLLSLGYPREVPPGAEVVIRYSRSLSRPQVVEPRSTK